MTEHRAAAIVRLRDATELYEAKGNDIGADYTRARIDGLREATHT
jgi:hypothetical protein